MCLAVPGKIIKIENDEAIVDYEIAQRKGMIIDDEVYQEGDYVIIQGGFVVQKIDTQEAKRALQLYKEALTSD